MRHIILLVAKKNDMCEAGNDWRRTRARIRGREAVEIFGYIAICNCDKSAKNREKKERERERNFEINTSKANYNAHDGCDCVCVCLYTLCVYLYENWILSKMIEFSINKFDLQQLRNVFKIF